jgi:hypothetical protein
MKPRCEHCGETIGWLEPSCRTCGARNAARRGLIGTAAAVLFLLAALAAAILVATREQPLIGGTPPPDQAAAPDDDFAWLSAMMKNCDDNAAQDRGSKHFLVIPLVADAGRAGELQELRLNTIGNAIVLTGTDTIAALKRGAARISPDEYVFRIKDDATGAVQEWDAATGVKWLATTDGGAIKDFKMQFKTRNKGSDNDWGNTLKRQDGECYWVNALPIP